MVWGTGDPFFDVTWAQWLATTIPGTVGCLELEGARLFFPLERWPSSTPNSAVYHRPPTLWPHVGSRHRIAGTRTSAYQARATATPAPKTRTSVIPTADHHGADQQVAEGHRSAETHDPQGHHPAPDGVAQLALQGGVQSGDEGEVEAPDHGHHHIGGQRRPEQGEDAEGPGVADQADPDDQGLDVRANTVPMEMAPIRAPVPKQA